MSKFNFLGFTPLPIESAAGLIEQLTRKVRQRRGDGDHDQDVNPVGFDRSDEKVEAVG